MNLRIMSFFYKRNKEHSFKDLPKYKTIIVSILEDRILWFTRYAKTRTNFSEVFTGDPEYIIESCTNTCNLYVQLKNINSFREENKNNPELHNKLLHDENLILDDLFRQREELKDYIKEHDIKKVYFNFFLSQEYIDKVSEEIAIQGGIHYNPELQLITENLY